MAEPWATNAAGRAGLIVVILIVLLVERRILQRYFFAELQAADDLHAGVVGQAGDDHALVEKFLPGVFLLFLDLFGALLLFRFFGEGLRVDGLLDRKSVV